MAGPDSGESRAERLFADWLREVSSEDDHTWTDYLDRHPHDRDRLEVLMAHWRTCRRVFREMERDRAAEGVLSQLLSDSELALFLRLLSELRDQDPRSR